MKTENNNTFSLFVSFLLVLSVIVIHVCPNASAADAATPAAPNTAAGGTAAPTAVPTPAPPTSTTAAAPIAQAKGPNADMSKVCMVFVETPQGQKPEAFHISILATALGSEQAAKDGIIYSYTEAASGFTAFINPEQIATIEKQPGVLAVNCDI